MSRTKRIAPALATHAEPMPLVGSTRPWIVYAPDKGDGDPATPGQEPEDSNPETPASPDKPADPAAQSIDALPEWAQQLVKDLRSENASHRTAKNAAQKAADEAAEAQLLSDKKFEELAAKRSEQIAELEPKAQLADALTERVRAQVDAEIAEWPEEVKNLLPQGDESEAVGVLEFLALVEKARPLAAKLKEQQETPPPGTSRRPAPNGQGGKTKSDEWRREARQQVKRAF